MEASKRKVFLITGTGRSGSTLLDLMLGNDEKGLSVGEMHALFRPWRPHHLLKNRGCFCDDKSCQFWSTMREKGERKVYSNIFNKFQEIDFIVDSSKKPLWLKDQLAYSTRKDYQLIPILIYKTPLEYAYSLYKRDDLEGWKSAWIGRHVRLLGILDDFISVKYKELAKNPSKKLKALCQELDIDYHEGKKRFWENQHDHFLFGSDTVKNSEQLVYYEDQYDQDKLDYLMDNLNLEESRLQDILKILEAHEVDSSNPVPESVIDLKESIGKFSFYDKLVLRPQSTPYYWINRSFSIMKNKIAETFVEN